MESGQLVDTRRSERVADLLVIGGGPAGCAAAIWSAIHGLNVTLLEAKPFPRHRPGETLHPGVEPLFRQLGVYAEVLKATAIRHEGHYVRWNGQDRYVPFGNGESGKWKGYQVLREHLDQILLSRAKEVGVNVFQPCFARAPIMSAGRIIGMQTSSGEIQAQFIVDASGAGACLQRVLRLTPKLYSQPLHAFYGYCEGVMPVRTRLPMFMADSDGWTWSARIGINLYHWSRLSFLSAARCRRPPMWFNSLGQTGRTGGADVTWRVHTHSATAGYFLVGDAAAVLDPATSHGVLRALMSGIMAGHAIAKVVAGALSESRAVAGYSHWLNESFNTDVARLAQVYSHLTAA